MGGGRNAALLLTMDLAPGSMACPTIARAVRAKRLAAARIRRLLVAMLAAMNIISTGMGMATTKSPAPPTTPRGMDVKVMAMATAKNRASCTPRTATTVKIMVRATTTAKRRAANW